MKLFYIYLSLVIVCDVVGSIFAKLWSIHQKPTLLVLNMLFYALTGLFFSLTLRHHGLAVANTLWVATAAIFIALSGFIVFKEQIHLVQGLGMAIIVLGLVLVNSKL